MPSTNANGATRGVVAIGASAGGVEALIQLVGNLPHDLPYPVLVALHMAPNAPSVLAQILDRSGPLPAQTAEHGCELTAGRIYVAVPDRHLLVHDHHVVLSEGPTENGHRPAINPLFRSVALDYGPRAIGVLLSGVLDDGVLGAAAIRSRGGVIIVQKPEDAVYPSIPLSAIRAGVVDFEVAASEIGQLLARLADREIEERDMDPDDQIEIENRIAMGRRYSPSFDAESLGPHSGYTCPDCTGSLMLVGENNYRCRVGHAWTADALLKARDDEIENALWVALRSLREKATLSRRLAAQVGPGMLQRRYIDLADEAERAVTVLGKRLSEATSDIGQRDDG